MELNDCGFTIKNLVKGDHVVWDDLDVIMDHDGNLVVRFG